MIKMYVLTNVQNRYADYLSYFPKALKDKLRQTPNDRLCEIRISKNRPVVLKYTYGRFYISLRRAFKNTN